LSSLLSSGKAKAIVGLLVALLAAAGIVLPGLESSDRDGFGSVETINQRERPVEIPAEEAAEIATVLAAIDSGDPLPYEEDGGTFQNREGLLPQQPLGYYREYTVETPGSPDRGARRLVIGEGGETYYTDDHYASFTRIDPADFP
jgi:ribonuclease T1